MNKFTFCILFLILNFLYGSNIIEHEIYQLESLFYNRHFNELHKKLSKIHSLIKISNMENNKEINGLLNLYEGHLCFFGEDKDKNIDLSCAWKKYVNSAKFGNSEALFYVGIFIENLMFDNLEILEELFKKKIEIVKQANDFKGKINALSSISNTLFYMSAISGFAPAMQLLGNRASFDTKKCNTASGYYSKAAHKLLPYFNQSFQNYYVKMDTILTSTDPYAKTDDLTEHTSGLRMYEQIASEYENLAEGMDLLGKIAEKYLSMRDYELAKMAAEKALSKDKNNSNSNYVLGVLHMSGVISPINYTQALPHLIIASEKKHAEALNALGFMYLHGYGVEQDEALAYEYFTSAFKAGSSSGGYNLASRSLSENRFSQTESLHNFLRTSKEDNIHGLYNLGIMFMYGLGVGVSCQNAVSHLKSATESMIWMKYFANSYELYTDREKKVATLKYLIMAEIGNLIAQINAGNLLDSINLFPENLWIHQYFPNLNLNKRLAFKYYNAAFDQGDEHVNIRLGDYYFYGYEIPQDYDIALGFYDRASYKAISVSLLAYGWFNYGLLYHYGLGVAKNYEKAKNAYNITSSISPHAYYPAKIMELILESEQNGFLETFWPKKVNKEILIFVLVFILAMLFLVLARK